MERAAAVLNGSGPGTEKGAKRGPSGVAAAEPAFGRRRWWVLVAMIFGLFMPMLDNMVVNVALPTIQHRLSAGVPELQWIVDGYTLAFAALMLTGGTLGDLYGRRKLFVVGLVVFILGSLMCGLSRNIDELIAFRALQGAGGSLLIPGSLSIITSTFHGRERGAAIGIWTAVAGLAIAIGPLLGGYLVQNFNWQAIFFVNVPVGLVAIALTLVVVSESRDASSDRKLDPPGVVTGTLALFFLVFATIEGNTRGWSDGLIVCSYALAATGLVAFLMIEKRRRSPMLPLRFFKVPTFAAAVGVAATVMFGIFGTTFFFSLYLQNVNGYTPVGTGVRLLPYTAVLLLVAPTSGRLSDRFGSR
jgi:EmrB/QacA subfamily drug resistance transporter